MNDPRRVRPADDIDSLRGRIGGTPVQEIRMIIDGRPRAVYLKLEGLNPGGSIKDRTALALVDHLDGSGALRPDTVLIESTSGNFGVGAAMIARSRGLRFVAVVDPKTTSENVSKMRCLGAEIELVEQRDASGGYLMSRLARVRELCRTSSRFVWLNQYGSQANPDAHRDSTGPELYRQLDRSVDAMFVAISTGGTLAGISRFFRDVSPQTRIVAVDAVGSVALGGTPGPRLLTGIGSSRASEFVTNDTYDVAVYVNDRQAFAACRMLDAALGLRVGGSSGAVLAACARYLAEHEDVARAACVCADTGENYASTIFDAAWLEGAAPGLSPADVAPMIRLDDGPKTRFGFAQSSAQPALRRAS